MNRAIVIHGLQDYVQYLKQAWKGYDLIWSGWKGDESKFTEEDTVLYNTQPKDGGVQNLGFQYTTVYNGVKYAKEKGYERILKWRSDMIPTNPDELMKLFDENSLNFLYWHDVRGGYFVDYILEGPAQWVFDAWDIDTFHGEFSERVTTDHLIGNYDYNCNFIGDKLNSQNDIRWLKKRINIASYNSIPEFLT